MDKLIVCILTTACITLSAGASVQRGSGDVDGGLEQLRHFRKIDSEQANSIWSEVQAGLSVPTESQWRVMSSMVDEKNLSDDLRLRVFTLACEKGSPSQVESLARTRLPGWTEEIAASWQEFKKSRRPAEVLPSAFVANIIVRLNSDYAHGWGAARDVILDAAKRSLAMEAPVDLRLAGSTLTLGDVLGGLPAPTTDISSVVEYALQKDNVTGAGGDPQLIELLDSTSIERLRPLVERFPSQPAQYPWAVADALAHLGDLKAVPYIERAAKAYEVSPEVCPVGSRLIGPDAAAGLRRLVRKIELQNPPRNLLSALRENEEPNLALAANLRIWAMRRALKLGVGSDEIRAAVLEYASRTDRRLDSLGRSERAATIAASVELRTAGIKLGVLHTNDMQAVPKPRKSGE